MPHPFSSATASQLLQRHATLPKLTGVSLASATPGRVTIAAGAAGSGTTVSLVDHAHQLPLFPCCQVYNSAAISATTGGTTYLTYDTEALDNATMHSTVSNTGRITITTAGLYWIFGQIDFASNNANNRGIVLRMNGSLEVGYDMRFAATGVPTRCNCSTLITCAVNDYFEMGGYNDSGTNLDMNAGTSIFKVTYEGPSA